jgi:5-methylcytosine-specific restriction endonuclease McrA
MAGWRDPATRRSLEQALGTDPTAFPTDALVRAPHWHDGQIDLLVAALTARAQGATAKEARAIIAKCRGEEIRDWFIRVGQNSGNYRYRVIARTKRVKGVTLRQPWPRALERPIIERDGYRCRYCGIRVIHANDFRAIARRLEMPALVSGRGNLRRHPLRLLAQATFDHVVPVTRMGRNDETNMVTACWSCNFGKDNYTLEELGIRRRVLASSPPVPQSAWNGLRDAAVMT